MKKKVILIASFLMSVSLVFAGIEDDIVGVWYADATTGDLGNAAPGGGALAGAGWTTYKLAINADGTFSVTGANPYDLAAYGGDEDGIVNYSGTYTIEPDSTPAWIDLTCLASDLQGFFPITSEVQPLQNGIFELSTDGTELTIQYGAILAFGIPRPTEFMTDSLDNYDCGTLVKQQLAGDLIGVWYADATTGDLGNAAPGSGSLAGAGWTTYELTINSDGTFSATGANPYDLAAYGGDEDGIVNYSGTYTIDPDSTPAWIDLTCLASDLQGFFPITSEVQPLQNGIAELSADGTELTIQYGAILAFGIPRPTEFMTDSLGDYDCGTLVKQTVSIDHYTTVAPMQFRLSQNYPNPFNPATTIEYDLLENAHVKLTISNVLGQHVATLVNEAQQKGRYEYRWVPYQLNSGVYFIRLETGENTETRKAVFLK